MNLGIIAITVFVLWIGSEIILARTKRSQSTDRRFDRSSLRLLWITIALSVNIGVLLSFQRIGYFGNGSPLFPFAGLVLIVCGLLVRWLAIISLKHQFTVDISITRNHQLVTKGIYRFVRHPAYAGSLLSFFGLGLFFSNYLSLLIIILPIYTAFLYRIRVEEKTLLDHFGEEYVNYCASTKRLIPGIF
jgi:protein-S-isoprenylcysteine O-methyltransferase Ste14